LDELQESHAQDNDDLDNGETGLDLSSLIISGGNGLSSAPNGISDLTMSTSSSVTLGGTSGASSIPFVIPNHGMPLQMRATDSASQLKGGSLPTAAWSGFSMTANDTGAKTAASTFISNESRTWNAPNSGTKGNKDNGSLGLNLEFM
jgi:hypothetical protein